MTGRILNDDVGTVDFRSLHSLKRKGIFRANEYLSGDTVRARPFDHVISKREITDNPKDRTNPQEQHHSKFKLRSRKNGTHWFQEVVLPGTGREAIIKSIKKISNRINRLTPFVRPGITDEHSLKLEKLEELLKRQTNLLVERQNRKVLVDDREELKHSRKVLQNNNETVRLDSGSIRPSVPVIYPDDWNGPKRGTMVKAGKGKTKYKLPSEHELKSIERQHKKHSLGNLKEQIKKG